MTLRNIVIFSIVVRDFVVEAASTNLLFGHKTLPASKSLLPAMLQYSNSSPFTSEYITWDTISLPAFIFMVFSLWRYLPLDISRDPYDKLKCSIILLHGSHRAAYSSWCPPQFLPPSTQCLLSGGRVMLPESCPSHRVSDRAWEPLFRLPHFCFLTWWTPAASVLQAGLSWYLHYCSITCWSCSDRLVFASPQDFQNNIFWYSCSLGLLHHWVPMLCSSLPSSCYSLWSPGKLLSLDRPSTPLLPWVSASHHQEWEAGLNSQPVSLSCWFPGANSSSLCSLGAGQLGKKPKKRDKQSSTNDSLSSSSSKF